MTDPARKIRWGVLGYARIAFQEVIPAILRASNSELHAIASRDAAKLAEARRRFNCPKVYGGYEELLRDPEIDAVYIPLPNSLHRQWTTRAAEHGKHILCEKPIALNAVECSEMIHACATHGVTLMEAFMYRYTERTRRVLEVLRSGALGDVRFISSTFRFLLTDKQSIRLQPELGGGALYDVGCYPVNFAGLVVDEIARLAAQAAGAASASMMLPESVSAECVRENDVDLIFSGVLKYSSGIVASLNCGLNAHEEIHSEIVGTKGVLNIPATFLDTAGPLTLTANGQTTEIPVGASDRYRWEIEDFADALLHRRTPLFGLSETLRNAEVMDWLFAASR